MLMADIKPFYAIRFQLNWVPVLWGPTPRELDAPLRLAEYCEHGFLRRLTGCRLDLWDDLLVQPHQSANPGVGEKLITVGYMSRDSKYIVHVATVGEISINAGSTTGLVQHYS